MNEPETRHRPVISLAIRPKADSDGLRLLQALEEIAQEDLAIRIEAGPGDGQTTLSGMDELHLESICDRILRQYKVEVDAGAAEVTYLETIRKQAEGEGRYIRQTGGSGNYGQREPIAMKRTRALGSSMKSAAAWYRRNISTRSRWESAKRRAVVFLLVTNWWM